MVDSFEYKGDDVLTIMSKYAVNRNKAVFKLINRHVPNKVGQRIKICEFGAGQGEFINRFVDFPMETHALEADQKYLQELSKSHHVFEDLEEVEDGYFDFIYLIDVLEHLEKDEYFLEQFYKKLCPGGRLFIYVPARMELFSDFDSSIGHYRRYHKDELREKLIKSSFRIKSIRYHEFISYFIVLFKNHLSMTNLSDFNPGTVKIYDKIFVPFTNVVEKFLNPPIGKSLFAVAEKS